MIELRQTKNKGAFSILKEDVKVGYFYYSNVDLLWTLVMLAPYSAVAYGSYDTLIKELDRQFDEKMYISHYKSDLEDRKEDVLPVQ